jgi:glycosyltransferase involved in cell wall biosynthesis
LIRLDFVTAGILSDEEAVVFYSGAGVRTIRAAQRLGILSVCQVHHCHVVEQDAILQREAAACGIRYSPIYLASEVRNQVREYGDADLILCPSSAVRDSFAARGISENKLIVVPHGITLPSRFPERSEERKVGPYRVLYMGQLHFRKGVRYLLDAISQLDDSSIECRLVGPDFGLSGIHWNQYSPGIQRPGAKKGADLWQEYADADIFVLPSVEEGFGLVVLEAMRAGLPVVITSAVGARDFVADGQEGFVVPPGDSEALKDKIVWLRDHPEERRRMGKLARARAETVKGWDDSAARLVAKLQQRLESRKSASLVKS